jgi:glycosyltransferase involved in cell wall biosynthesis
MTHILFISRYYPPEQAAAAVCVHEFARHLVASGHQVTVLTTVPNYPTGIVPSHYRRKQVYEEWLDGIRVVRVWSYTCANTGFGRRILSQLSFALLAPALGGHAARRADIIIAGSPPLFNAIAARFLAWRWHLPYIFWVADLWPESAVQLGVLRNRLLIRLAEWLEWSTYRHSRLVWTVTRGMYETLLFRGLSTQKMLFLPNGVNTTTFCPMPQQEARLALGWDRRFTVLYAGTHGLSHGLTTLLKAASLLRKRSDIRFVLVGDGAEKARLMALARQHSLTNVTFLDPVPHKDVPQLLSAADVCLAHTRKLSLFEGMLPIKMYEAMACARPLILALNGEARYLVEQAEAALVVEPENASALASAILRLYTDRDEAALLGQHGRAYVQAHFDYALLTRTLDLTLKQIVPSQSTRRDTVYPRPNR